MHSFDTIPTTLLPELRHLPEDLGVRGNQAHNNLKRRGLIVMAGMTAVTAAATGALSQQKHVREYCPNDSGRFGTVALAATWNKKEGGRAVFPLMQYVKDKNFEPVDLTGVNPLDLDPSTLRVVGNSWEGRETEEEKITGMPYTFAERIFEAARGKRASVDYAVVTVAGGAAMYGITQVGLQTYNSNPAKKGYELAGFVNVPLDKPDEELIIMRPSILDPDVPLVPDIRRFMAYDIANLDELMPPDPVLSRA